MLLSYIKTRLKLIFCLTKILKFFIMCVLKKYRKGERMNIDELRSELDEYWVKLSTNVYAQVNGKKYLVVDIKTDNEAIILETSEENIT